MALIRIILVLGAAACASRGAPSPREPAAEPTVQVVLASDVEWEQLNPARGDMSPRAGTLWGDRRGTEPTGFLLRPIDGFESPPHIHNISYRGVVIRGVIHNDDPDADEMWMPAGSFWTQPKGAVHITAAKGTDTLAYIEIEEGPYLVRPPEEAFETPERPVNVDQSNIVWVPVDGAEVAFLWGAPFDGELHGTLVKLPGGFSGTIGGHGSPFRAVVIQGRPDFGQSRTTLEPGSYFSSEGATPHEIVCNTAEACVLYLRASGRVAIAPD
ncbi:MAG: DUF4437 domain-containing protein [Myxococcota bacterium]